MIIIETNKLGFQKMKFKDNNKIQKKLKIYYRFLRMNPKKLELITKAILN